MNAINEQRDWPNPVPASFRSIDETQLDRLKNGLLRDAVTSEANPDHVVVLRRAANEAAALAWLEPFPLLAFPELFREKVQVARRLVLRQAGIRSKSSGILPKAA